MSEETTDLTWTHKLEALSQLLQERGEASGRDCAKAESAAHLAMSTLDDIRSAKLAIEALSASLLTAVDRASATVSATASEAGSAAQRQMQDVADKAVTRVDQATQDATRDAAARIIETADREVSERARDLTRRHDDLAQHVDQALTRLRRNVRILQLVCAGFATLAILLILLRIFRS